MFEAVGGLGRGRVFGFWIVVEFELSLQARQLLKLFKCACKSPPKYLGNSAETIVPLCNLSCFISELNSRFCSEKFNGSMPIVRRFVFCRFYDSYIIGFLINWRCFKVYSKCARILIVHLRIGQRSVLFFFFFVNYSIDLLRPWVCIIWKKY